MEIGPTASAFLVIGYLFCALITAIVLGVMAMALTKLNAKLEELVGKVDPLLVRADQILTVTNEKIGSIGDKAEGILAQGEETAESVHLKVDKTAAAVQRTINAPIIRVNSLAAGLSRGVETFTKLQRGAAGGNGGAVPEPSEAQENQTTIRNGHGETERVAALAGKGTENGG